MNVVLVTECTPTEQADRTFGLLLGGKPLAEANRALYFHLRAGIMT